MRLVNLCGIAILATFVITGAAMRRIQPQRPVAGPTGSTVVSLYERGSLPRRPCSAIRPGSRRGPRVGCRRAATGR